MKHIYKMKLRSTAPGAQPEGFIQCTDRFIIYDAPLSDDDIFNYDLEYITPDLIRADITALLDNFKDFSTINKIVKLEAQLKNIYFSKILNDKNINRGVKIIRDNSIILISKGFKDSYRVTVFTKDYKPINHADYKTLDQLIDTVFKKYKLEILETL